VHDLHRPSLSHNRDITRSPALRKSARLSLLDAAL
jgi:hypothetical protein